jgi:hypothetical protein
VRLGSITREFSRARISIMSSTSIFRDLPIAGSFSAIAPSLGVSRGAGRIHRANAWRDRDFPVTSDVGILLPSAGRGCVGRTEGRGPMAKLNNRPGRSPFQIPKPERRVRSTARWTIGSRAVKLGMSPSTVEDRIKALKS